MSWHPERADHERRRLQADPCTTAAETADASATEADTTGAGAEEVDTDEVAAADGSGPEAGRKRTKPLRTWKRLRRRVGRSLVAWIGPTVLGRLARTWKMMVIAEENLDRAREENRGHLMALWHGRMLLGLPHHGQRDWSVLVSASGDGDISQSLLEGFRYRVIRGSSSRGGSKALREMLKVLDRGEVLIITPDGPRGPRHSINPGLAWMAKATGFPIVPLGFAVDRAWRMKSWDRFTIPKPGARVAMVYGEPFHVPSEAGEEALAEASTQLHERLVAAERRAFAFLGLPVDW